MRQHGRESQVNEHPHFINPWVQALNRRFVFEAVGKQYHSFPLPVSALKQHGQKEISMLTIKGSRQTIFRDYEKLKLSAPINNLYPTGDGVSKGANCMNVKVWGPVSLISFLPTYLLLHKHERNIPGNRVQFYFFVRLPKTEKATIAHNGPIKESLCS